MILNVVVSFTSFHLVLSSSIFNDVSPQCPQIQSNDRTLILFPPHYLIYSCPSLHKEEKNKTKLIIKKLLVSYNMVNWILNLCHSDSDSDSCKLTSGSPSTRGVSLVAGVWQSRPVKALES